MKFKKYRLLTRSSWKYLIGIVSLTVFVGGNFTWSLCKWVFEKDIRNLIPFSNLPVNLMVYICVYINTNICAKILQVWRNPGEFQSGNYKQSLPVFYLILFFKPQFSFNTTTNTIHTYIHNISWNLGHFSLSKLCNNRLYRVL